jgi:hypothetical protein
VSVLDLLSILSVVLMLVVLRSVRRERIRVEYSVAWLAAAALVLALSRAEETLRHVADYFGMTETWLALLILVLMVFLAVFYRFSRVVSELKDMNITLTQRIAILEYRLQERDEEKRA